MLCEAAEDPQVQLEVPSGSVREVMRPRLS